MAEIIDLNLLIPEDITFKIGEKIYKIPTTLDTGTILTMYDLEQKIAKTSKSSVKDGLLLQDKIVYILFSKLNDVTEEWVNGLAQTQKNAILKHYRARVEEINADPNFNTLPSQK